MSWSSGTITAVRILVSDTEVAKQIRGEIPTNKRNGVNTLFQLERYPIVAGSVYLTSGTTYRAQTGFTIDTANGLISFTVAPTGSENPWFVDYHWQWFSDTEYGGFLDVASYDLGLSPTTTIPAGLTNALYHYAAYHFYEAASAKYAARFNSSGGNQGVSIDVVTGNWRKLADAAKAQGDAMKLAYYQRHGQREAPAAAIESANLDPWAPMR